MCHEFVHGCLEADAKLREILCLGADNGVRKFVADIIITIIVVVVIVAYDKFNCTFAFEIYVLVAPLSY
jgi:hypothetical protein